MQCDDFEENIRLHKEEQYDKWKSITLDNFFRSKRVFRPSYVQKLIGVQDYAGIGINHGRIRFAYERFNELIWPEVKEHLKLFESDFSELENYAVSRLDENNYLDNFIKKVTSNLAKKYSPEKPISKNVKLIHNIIKKERKRLFDKDYLKHKKEERKRGLESLMREAEAVYSGF